MSSRACSCSEQLSNTGTPGCQPLFKVAKKFILVPTYDSTGARNKLDAATLFTPALLTAKLNATDKTQRWYPTADLENVGGDREDSVFDTAPSGKKSFVKKGTRTVTAEVWDQGPEYAYQLEAARCNEFSIFVVDLEGNIRGMDLPTADGYLYPIRIDKNSFDVKPIFATDTTTEKLMITFDWAQSERDDLLRVISASDMTADLLSAEGLLDISATYSSISTTSVTITLEERYGSKANKNKLSGLLETDFFDVAGGTAERLYNVTDASAVTIATFTESSDGVYVITFTAQTSADVIRVTPVKNGYDFADVTAETFAIP